MQKNIFNSENVSKKPAKHWMQRSNFLDFSPNLYNYVFKILSLKDVEI